MFTAIRRRRKRRIVKKAAIIVAFMLKCQLFRIQSGYKYPIKAKTHFKKKKKKKKKKILKETALGQLIIVILIKTKYSDIN